jgi:hypothetical protein
MSKIPLGPFCFDTLDQAKKLFEPFYKTLSTEKVTSDQYRKTLIDLVRVHPVIIGLEYDNNNALSKMHQWYDSMMTYTSEIPIIQLPHVVTPMKKGFIDTHQELDIIKDIESITRIDPEGRIEIIQFNISHLLKGDSNSIEILTENKAQEILRRRGFI